MDMGKPEYLVSDVERIFSNLLLDLIPLIFKSAVLKPQTATVQGSSPRVQSGGRRLRCLPLDLGVVVLLDVDTCCSSDSLLHTGGYSRFC